MSKILFCSSVEGISVVVSAGFEALNKLPVFMLGNNFSKCRDAAFYCLFLQDTAVRETAVKFIFVTLRVTEPLAYGDALLEQCCPAGSKTGRRQEIGHEAMKIQASEQELAFHRVYFIDLACRNSLCSHEILSP